MFELKDTLRLHASELIALVCLALPSFEISAVGLYTGTILIKLPFLLLALTVSSVDVSLVIPVNRLTKEWQLIFVSAVVALLQIAALYLSSINFWAYHANVQMLTTSVDILLKALIFLLLICRATASAPKSSQVQSPYPTRLLFVLLGVSIFATEFIADKMLLDPDRLISMSMAIWRMTLLFVLFYLHNKEQIQKVLLGIFTANTLMHFATFDLEIRPVHLLATAFLSVGLLCMVVWLKKRFSSEQVPEAEPEYQDDSSNPMPLRMLEVAQDRGLSKRETEVVFADLSGKNSNHIAQELGISASAVSTYKSRAFEKLNVSTKSEVLDLVLDMPAGAQKPKVLHQRRITLKVFLQVSIPLSVLFVTSKVLSASIPLDLFMLTATLGWLCFLILSPFSIRQLSSYTSLSCALNLCSFGFCAALLIGSAA